MPVLWRPFCFCDLRAFVYPGEAKIPEEDETMALTIIFPNEEGKAGIKGAPEKIRSLLDNSFTGKGQESGNLLPRILPEFQFVFLINPKHPQTMVFTLIRVNISINF